MAGAIVTSDPEQRTSFEPLYDIEPQTGDTIEVFYADRVLARAFGKIAAGWYWWMCKPGCLPDCEPIGAFPTSYSAYRDALGCTTGLFVKEPNFEQ